ncbi:MAG: tail fiber domain-containing protein, partial [Bacteroidota bacterium]|nr:tail fiber domain-containing protein [Bacteroidota bacterium]
LDRIDSYEGNPAITISPSGDVGFFNPLMLETINSYGGNPAISINANGDVGLSNDLSVEGDVVISSDKRLKSNIISLGGTLTKLLQIDGKSYTMKKDENKIQKIGLLAQDIEKVFPELVSESHGVKSVNYQGLVPVLINALKEQDEKMKSQQSQIDELRALVQNLIN